MKIDLRKYTGVTKDSREVRPGYLFFCVDPKYALMAIEKGAAAIVSTKDFEASVPVIVVEDFNKAVAETAALFYQMQPEHMVAVTGTNGKTSIVAFVTQICELLGHKAAGIGTLGVSYEGKIEKGENTTPGAIEIHRTLEMLAGKGIDYAAFEASSHGLDQRRIDGVRIEAAGFTNLTQDHLDYHKDMATYLQAKKRLFTEVLPVDGLAVLNADIPEFEELRQIDRKVLSYGFKADGLSLLNVDIVEGGQRIKLFYNGTTLELMFRVAGHFQVMNLLCAIGLCMGMGLKFEEIVKCVPDLRAPTGRLDFVGKYNGATIYVDYAHTPDALDKALQAMRAHTNGKLVVVFGCGGDRDPTKRPIMGKVASDLADVAIVTDDNPRSEEPALIRAQVLAACPKGIDGGERGEAIARAIAMLNDGDVLLIAGKGHEDYQIIKGVSLPFSDIEVVRELIAQKNA